MTGVAVLTSVTAFVACVIMSLSGCAAAEPPPTACPLPSLPAASPDTDGADITVPAGSVDPRCSGGDLSPAEAAELLADTSTKITVIDTRTPAEYAGGHVPGAVNLSTQDAAFWDDVGQLPVDGVYVLYCRSGSVTQRVMQQMLAMGFGSVCHIESGYNGWLRAGLPVEEGAA